MFKIFLVLWDRKSPSPRDILNWSYTVITLDFWMMWLYKLGLSYVYRYGSFISTGWNLTTRRNLMLVSVSIQVCLLLILMSYKLYLFTLQGTVEKWYSNENFYMPTVYRVWMVTWKVWILPMHQNSSTVWLKTRRCEYQAEWFVGETISHGLLWRSGGQ